MAAEIFTLYLYCLWVYYLLTTWPGYKVRFVAQWCNADGITLVKVVGTWESAVVVTVWVHKS